MTSLTIIRGLPGSGKSTLAKSLARTMANSVIFEADMYFLDAEGNYNFNPEKLRQAHEWCQDSVNGHLHYGMEVIVSNTFTTHKEMKPYLKMAADRNLVPNIILCQNNYGSIHKVPQESLDRMKARFQYEIGEPS